MWDQSFWDCVSVPWRGLRSFGLTVIGPPTGRLTLVSVPWRGLRSFGRDCHDYPAWSGHWFPSPGGDYGLSDWGTPHSARHSFGSFRPLAGITVFRTRVDPDADGYPSDEFPSPGGDYGLSDVGLIVALVLAAVGFRPLAGITVFRTSGGQSRYSREALVSVPWRGLRSFGLWQLLGVGKRRS